MPEPSAAHTAAARETIRRLSGPEGELERARLERHARSERAKLVDVDLLPGDSVPRATPAGNPGLPARSSYGAVRRALLELRRSQTSKVGAENCGEAGNAGTVSAAEAAAPSLLESLGITDPCKVDKATFLGDADPYLAEIEQQTAPFRRARARRYRDRALSIIALEPFEEVPELLAEGLPDPPDELPRPITDETVEWVAWKDKVTGRARWHVSRATGSLERFPRLLDCGEARVVATCNRGCGVQRTSPAHCAVGRLCLSCRARAAKWRKARFSEARRVYLDELRHVGVLAGGARRGRVPRGGEWGEKFLTLTVPHVDIGAIEGGREACESKGIGPDSHTVAARIALIFEAWRHFSLRLQAWGRRVRRACGNRASVAWYRAFEWTPSEDSRDPDAPRRGEGFGGHPHFHLWIVAPFLAQELLEEWWRAALERAGLTWDGPLMVDIREWTMPGEGRVHELIKGERSIRSSVRTIEAVQYIEGWSIVDMVQGEKIAADVAARLYEALDGKRLVQASSEFLDPPLHACPFCNAEGATDVRIEKPEIPRASLERIESTAPK